MISPKKGFPGGSEGKVSACNAGDLGLILGSGRPPGEGNGNPVQYSCLENPMEKPGGLQSIIAKSQTRLSDFTFVTSLSLSRRDSKELLICGPQEGAEE